MSRMGRRNFGRQRPTFSPGGSILKLDELQDRLRRSLAANPSVDPLALVFALADAGASIEDNNIATPGRRPVFTIATAMFAALREVERPYPVVSTDQSPFIAQHAAADILLNQADGVFSDEYVEVHRADAAADQAARKRELRLNMIWTLAENGIFQGEMISRLGSALVLTGLSGFRALPAAPALTNALFERHLGLSAYDYALILFALWAMSPKQPLLTISRFLEPGPRRDELTRHTASIVSSLARRTDQYRDLSDVKQFESYSGKALASAVFQRFPFIQLNEDQFVASAHPFLRVQLSSKFLTKALALARKEAKPEEQGRTAYSAFVGRDRFEPFVRELCDLWCPGHHFDEYEYLSSGNQKSPDRIAFEAHGKGEVAVLIQLKTKMVLEATHFGADAESLSKDLRSALSETVYKSIQFLAALDRASSADGLRPTHEGLSRRILECRHLCLLGVVPELPAIFTMSDVRKMLWAEAERRLSQDDIAWLERNRARLRWHVIGLDEFLLFLGLPESDRHLFKRLSGFFREANPDQPFIDLHGRFPVSFRNYLALKYKGRLEGARVGLQAVVQSMVEDALRLFRTGPT